MIKDRRFLRYFMPLCPTYHYIDRADGMYARAMQYEKDYAAILSAAWEIDGAIDRYLRDPDQDNAELMHLLGIDEQAKDDAELKLRKLLDSSLTKGSFKERYCDPFAMWEKRLE